MAQSSKKRSGKPRPTKEKDKAAPAEETTPASPAKSSKPRRMRVETAAALAHLLGPVTAVFFLATDSRAEVRLQAWQSLVFSIVVVAASLLLYYSLIGILLLPPLFLATLLVWLSAIWRAAVGIRWRMPIIYPLLRKGGLVK